MALWQLPQALLQGLSTVILLPLEASDLFEDWKVVALTIWGWGPSYSKLRISSEVQGLDVLNSKWDDDGLSSCPSITQVPSAEYQY